MPTLKAVVETERKEIAFSQLCLHLVLLKTYTSMQNGNVKLSIVGLDSAIFLFPLDNEAMRIVNEDNISYDHVNT